MRIWDPATGHVQTLMRVDSSISRCLWLGSDALAIQGLAGFYFFEFLTSTSHVITGQ